MKARRFNWPIWAGFLLSLIAFLSYFFVFVWFPVTRDFPWANLLLFGVAAALLLVGVRREFAPDRGPQAGSPPGVADQPRPTRSKIAGAVLATLSIAIFGFFIFSTFIVARRLPASHRAPQVGQKAPDFTLSDTNGKPVSLSQLLSEPINREIGGARRAASPAGQPGWGAGLARNEQEPRTTPRGVLLLFYRGYW